MRDARWLVIALALLAGLVCGLWIAASTPRAEADDVEVEWTWRAAPSDRVNTEAMERMRAAKVAAIAKAPVLVAVEDGLSAMAAMADPEPSWEPSAYSPEPYYAPAAQAYDMPGDGLTRSGGVNYHDGRTETYYSSNVLYHHRTSEWTVDSEGFYRTDSGQYVVAASDMPIGTTFQGSKGECVVMDSGCDAGVTDYYVQW